MSSGELLDHSKEHFLINRQEQDWNPEGKCDLWLKTIDEIFENDPDKEEKIETLQMWFGYCLTSDTKHQKSLWLVGEGANGKSLICKILTELIGRGNVSGFMITDLDKSFNRSGLYGKLLNISNEISANATLSDGYFKAIVGEDDIQAEKKFKDTFSFKCTARLMIATNQMKLEQVKTILNELKAEERSLILMKYQDNMSQVAALQPDYLGFIFYKNSPRDFEDTIPELSKSIKKVGVFVDEKVEVIVAKIENTNLREFGCIEQLIIYQSTRYLSRTKLSKTTFFDQIKVAPAPTNLSRKFI